MNTLELTDVRPEDISLLYGLIFELAEYEKMTQDMHGSPEDLRASIFDRKAARALLAKCGGEVVGYAIWCYNFSTFECKPGLYLEDIYIRPQHRRCGFGGQILRHLAALAVREDCARMEWSVLDWNKNAIDFYEKLGARANRGWTVYRLDGESLRRAGEGSTSSS